MHSNIAIRVAVVMSLAWHQSLACNSSHYQAARHKRRFPREMSDWHLVLDSRQCAGKPEISGNKAGFCVNVQYLRAATWQAPSANVMVTKFMEMNSKAVRVVLPTISTVSGFVQNMGQGMHQT